MNLTSKAKSVVLTLKSPFALQDIMITGFPTTSGTITIKSKRTFLKCLMEIKRLIHDMII